MFQSAQRRTRPSEFLRQGYSRQLPTLSVCLCFAGDFFSKDSIKLGIAILHPRGIHFGPHPKAQANQATNTRTDEYAVMPDELNSTEALAAGEAEEWKDFSPSWGAKK